MANYTQSEREQAARVLGLIRRYLEYEAGEETLSALDTAIAVLLSPCPSPETDGKAGGWVRTSERVPEGDGTVMTYTKNLCGYYMLNNTCAERVRERANSTEYWTPLPALPEVGHNAP